MHLPFQAYNPLTCVRLSNHYDFVKPNDLRALELMNAAAQHTVHILPDIFLGFGHSDEYSFVFHRTCTLFERRSAKIASTVVSTFTSAYIYLWPRFFSLPPLVGTFFARVSTADDTNNNNNHAPKLAEDNPPITGKHASTELDLAYLPTFDARCVQYPSIQNLRDYLSWRQADCHINNLYNTTFWALVLKGNLSNTEAEEFLKGTISSDKHEILWSRFDINYNNEPEIYRKGSIVLRQYAVLELLPGAAKGSNVDTYWKDGVLGPEEEMESSKTQLEKMRKARQRAKIVVEHVDIIKDDFWLRRPWLLSGKPGQPVMEGI